MVGRSTVCDDIASRLLFVSPITPTCCYVLCDVRLPEVVLLQSLLLVTEVLVCTALVYLGQLCLKERGRCCGR